MPGRIARAYYRSKCDDLIKRNAYVVTAPSLALLTELAYFANTPRL
jgi:hypothetical protein